ncbi:MAG: AAA family ATPase, partial [bacterium]|nr:AAA family ATPase [bacterium]
ATGLGKSLFAANLVLSAAGTEWEWLGWRRANTMLVCTEMRLPDVAKRLIALRGNIDMSRVRDGRLDESERTAARDAADWMRDLPLQIDARGKVSIGRVMRMARSEKRAGKLDLLVVDLVTHIRHEGRIDSREQQVAQVSQELSDLAVDLDIPIVLTCQVNRAVQQRGDKEPQTDDLRYSAALGHDASIVSFLWRQKDWPGLRTDITTTKNRNGSLGTASLRRVPRFAQFTSWEPDMATQGQFV